MDPSSSPPDEGRFFGGGLTSTQEQILEFFDKNDKPPLPSLDLHSLKKLVVALEKAVAQNSQMRAKYSHDPQKFLDSEALLDEKVKEVSALAFYPNLYPEFAQLGGVTLLVTLIAHDNVDIAVDVLQVVGELTDDDVECQELDMRIDTGILQLTTQNWARLDDEGIYHAMRCFENFASFDQTIAQKMVDSCPIYELLLPKIQAPEMSQTKQYAIELAAVLLSCSKPKKLDSVIEVFLQAVSQYKKRDPPKEEEEFMENAFDCLCALVAFPGGREAFLQAEGVELCLIMMKSGKASRPRSLKVLDHAMTGFNPDVPLKFIEKGGLKLLFALFMKNLNLDTLHHILSIFLSLFRALPADSPSRIRTLAKFIECEYEKLFRLVSLWTEIYERYTRLNSALEAEKVGLTEKEQIDRALEFESRKEEAGEFNLVVSTLIIAWLWAEDDGAKSKIEELLEANGRHSNDLCGILNEYIENIGQPTNQDASYEKEMASTLQDLLLQH